MTVNVWLARKVTWFWFYLKFEGGFVSSVKYFTKTIRLNQRFMLNFHFRQRQKVMILICHINSNLKWRFFVKSKMIHFLCITLKKGSLCKFLSKRRNVDLNSSAIDLKLYLNHLAAWLTITFFRSKNYQKKIVRWASFLYNFEPCFTLTWNIRLGKIQWFLRFHGPPISAGLGPCGFDREWSLVVK